jgi:hypothetical protein
MTYLQQCKALTISAAFTAFTLTAAKGATITLPNGEVLSRRHFVALLLIKQSGSAR